MHDLFESVRPTGPAARTGRFVRVALERGIDTGAGSAGFTYRVMDDPPGDPVRVGERVEVPLGVKDRRAAGIVTAVGGPELLDGLPPRMKDRHIKPILRRTGVRLPERLVELAEWISEYYLAPLGMTLAAMMPAAVKRGIGERDRAEVERVSAEEEGARADAIASLPPTAAAAWTALQGLPPETFPAPARDLADALAIRTIGPVNRLIKAGLLRLVERTVIRAAAPAWEGLQVEASPHPQAVALTPEQLAAVEGVTASLGGFGVHLLRGVTGSGKTEVYLRTIENVLARGQRAIVLVPEIALTPQTAGRFMARFGHAGVAVLHSALSAGQRHQQWAMAAAGKVGVVVGARSAVFSPLDRLGLIVVDEEHDSSGYKQDQVPRYHGRDVAIKRAQIEGCPVLLGSATPSLESWANAIGERPRYRLWELTERVGGGSLPRVEVVDMADERRTRAREGDRANHLLGPRLERALGETLAAGGQAILLLNRRGYAALIGCPNVACGWSMQCEYCDARMVLHKRRRLQPRSVVRCHHCLAEQKPPQKCPQCEGKVTVVGTGTQRLEDEIAGKFADLDLGDGRRGLVDGETMLRVDSDTMHTARDYFEALGAFASGKLRLLLGTQLIAKGLDYPNVRLVGVVSADTALYAPDFRAGERTFQLVSQVAGRTGRGTATGRVIVQTFEPEYAAIRFAAAHDYVAFATAELALRRDRGLPPATRMARIVVRDESYQKAEAHAAAIAERLRARTDGARSASKGQPGAPPDPSPTPTTAVRIEGPMPATIERIAGQYRIAIEITAPTARDLLRPLARLRAEGMLKSDAKCAVDVDPASLM